MKQGPERHTLAGERVLSTFKADAQKICADAKTLKRVKAMDNKQNYEIQVRTLQVLERLEMLYAPRSSNAALEAFQRQFPGTAVLPFPHQVANVVAATDNYVKQITVPSGAQVAILTANNGAFLSRGNIVFPFTEDENAAFCFLHRYFWIRDVGTLTVGLLNAGDIASISFYSQLNI